MQDEPDDEFLLRPDFLRGVALLKKYDLTYDILIYPKQLKAAAKFVALFPEQPFVVDHIVGEWENGIRVVVANRREA